MKYIAAGVIMVGGGTVGAAAVEGRPGDVIIGLLICLFGMALLTSGNAKGGPD